MGRHKRGRLRGQGMPGSGQGADSGAEQETGSLLGSQPQTSANWCWTLPDISRQCQRPGWETPGLLGRGLVMGSVVCCFTLFIACWSCVKGRPELSRICAGLPACEYIS